MAKWRSSGHLRLSVTSAKTQQCQCHQWPGGRTPDRRRLELSGAAERDQTNYAGRLQATLLEIAAQLSTQAEGRRCSTLLYGAYQVHLHLSNLLRETK